MGILEHTTLHICKFLLLCSDTEHQLRISPWLPQYGTEQGVKDCHSNQGATEDIRKFRLSLGHIPLFMHLL